MKWEETTNPTMGNECWTLSIPVLDFKAILVKIHRSPSKPDEKIWYLSSFSPTIVHKPLEASELDEAKQEALQYLHEIINAMDTAIGAAAMEGKLVYSKEEA